MPRADIGKVAAAVAGIRGETGSDWSGTQEVSDTAFYNKKKKYAFDAKELLSSFGEGHIKRRIHRSLSLENNVLK